MQHIIFFVAMFTMNLDVDKNFHPPPVVGLMNFNSAEANEHIASEDGLSE